MTELSKISPTRPSLPRRRPHRPFRPPSPGHLDPAHASSAASFPTRTPPCAVPTTPARRSSSRGVRSVVGASVLSAVLASG